MNVNYSSTPLPCSKKDCYDYMPFIGQIVTIQAIYVEGVGARYLLLYNFDGRPKVCIAETYWKHLSEDERHKYI